MSLAYRCGSSFGELLALVLWARGKAAHRRMSVWKEQTVFLLARREEQQRSRLGSQMPFKGAAPVTQDQLLNFPTPSSSTMGWKLSL